MDAEMASGRIPTGLFLGSGLIPINLNRKTFRGGRGVVEGRIINNIPKNSKQRRNIFSKICGKLMFSL